MSEKLLFVLLMGMASCVLATGLQDPTRPADYRAAAPAGAEGMSEEVAPVSLQVSEVHLSPRRHTAVINGKRLAVGDHIGKARLIRIEPGQVVLLNDGQRLELPLVQSNVKQRVVKNKANRK